MISTKNLKSVLVFKTRKLFNYIKEWVLNPLDWLLYFCTVSKKHETKTIVFVGVVMHARIGRLAKYIKREVEINCILVLEKARYTKELSNSHFDNTILYRSSNDLRRILKIFDSKNCTIYTFGPPHFAAFKSIQYYREKSKINPPVFFDYQDLLISNFGLEPPFVYMKKDLIREEYILKNADGIISHSLELQTAKKYFNKIETQVLYFPLYVDSDYFVEKNYKNKKEINLVYVGAVYSKFQDPSYFGGAQLHWLIEKLETQKIHFHIYPSPTITKPQLLDYYNLDKELEYFHLHKPVKQEYLSDELNQYDYGVIPFFNHTNSRLDAKRHFSTTLKLFNFIESGIPIIMGSDTFFQNFIGRKYGGCISLNFHQFDNIEENLSKYDYQLFLKNIRLNRDQMSLENKIYKLIQFLEL